MRRHRRVCWEGARREVQGEKLGCKTTGEETKRNGTRREDTQRNAPLTDESASVRGLNLLQFPFEVLYTLHATGIRRDRSGGQRGPTPTNLQTQSQQHTMSACCGCERVEQHRR